MTDFLEEKKREISARLKELKPLVDEYHRLEAAAAALDGVGDTASAPSGSTRGASAPRRGRGTAAARTTTGGGSGTGRRGRPRGKGTRSKQGLDLVARPPGNFSPEMAQEMGIQ